MACPLCVPTSLDSASHELLPHTHTCMHACMMAVGGKFSPFTSGCHCVDIQIHDPQDIFFSAEDNSRRVTLLSSRRHTTVRAAALDRRGTPNGKFGGGGAHNHFFSVQELPVLTAAPSTLWMINDSTIVLIDCQWRECLESMQL